MTGRYHWGPIGWAAYHLGHALQRLAGERCTCRAWPHRIEGGTVQVGGVVHQVNGPCYLCDTYGRPV